MAKLRPRLAARIAQWRRNAQIVLADPTASDTDRSEALLLQACALQVDLLLVTDPSPTKKGS